MNNGGIMSYSGINEKNLRKYDYTNTLAVEAVRAAIADEHQLEKLRNDLMDALAQIISLYTKNLSSSVKADTARELAASMLFNIDTCLLSIGDHRKASNILFSRKPFELYGQGYLINKKRLENAKNLYGKVRLSRPLNPSEEYIKTLDKYYRYYLSNYDPRFSAHNKIYLTLLEYNINGAFHIDKAIRVLEKLLEINTGRKADVTAAGDAGSGCEE